MTKLDNARSFMDNHKEEVTCIAVISIISLILINSMIKK